MKRILLDRPAAYNLAKLATEIQAAESRIIAVNEVDCGSEGVKVAVYTEDGVTLSEATLAAIVAAHDPTPPTPQPTLEQRLAEALERIAVLEQAQATLGAEVGKVTALGAMSQPIE